MSLALKAKPKPSTNDLCHIQCARCGYFSLCGEEEGLTNDCSNAVCRHVHCTRCDQLDLVGEHCPTCDGRPPGDYD